MNRRRTRLAAALLLGLAGVGTGWWWYQGQADHTAAARLNPAGAATGATPASAAAPTPPSAASQAEAAARAHPLPVTGWEPATDGQDPCSLAAAHPQADAATSAALTGRASPEAVEQVVKALTALPSPEAQALAAWWPSINAGQQAAIRLNEQTAACQDNLACERRAFGQFVSARAAARDPGSNALARLAADTGQPGVYAMAVEACKAHPWASDRPDPAQCQLITLERWAQVDADNAVPWLYLANQALQRQDEAGVAEALHRASQARRNHQVGSELIRHAQPALATLPAADRLGLAWQLVTGVQATWSLPGYGTVTNFCSAEALTDPNRRPTCEGLAALLLERSTLMVERNIGIRMAERLGWPADRLDALKQERDALYAAFEETLRGDPKASACVATRHALHTSALIAELGEVGLARAVVARSGLTVEAYAQRAAARVRQLAEAVAAAPQAASVASAVR